MRTVLGSFAIGAFLALMGALFVRLVPPYVGIIGSIVCVVAIVFCTPAPEGYEDKDEFHLT